MSGVAIIKKLLNAATSTQVIAVQLPIGSTLPAIVVTDISGKMRDTLAGDERIRLETERIQVTVVAKSYTEQKALLQVVRDACKAVERLFVLSSESVMCKSVIEDFRGPVFYDSEVVLYMQSVDFMVKYQRSI